MRLLISSRCSATDVLVQILSPSGAIQSFPAASRHERSFCTGPVHHRHDLRHVCHKDFGGKGMRIVKISGRKYWMAG